MPDIERMMERLQQAGHDPVYLWDAPPNEEDPDHAHDFDTHLEVVAGEIEITVGAEKVTLEVGDQADILRGVIHSGKAGLEGCKYVVAERH